MDQLCHFDLEDPFRLAKIQRKVKTPGLESGQRKKEFFSFGEVQIVVPVSVRRTNIHYSTFI